MSHEQHVVLTDQYDEGVPRTIGVTISVSTFGICIRPDGHGDMCSLLGEGWPILMELFDGEFRVSAWGDINQEDPTHDIWMGGAREAKREDDEQRKMLE